MKGFCFRSYIFTVVLFIIIIHLMETKMESYLCWHSNPSPIEIILFCVTLVLSPSFYFSLTGEMTLTSFCAPCLRAPKFLQRLTLASTRTPPVFPHILRLRRCGARPLPAHPVVARSGRRADFADVPRITLFVQWVQHKFRQLYNDDDIRGQEWGART